MDNDLSYQNTSKILIADDVEANRVILKYIMQDMGLDTILAENGAEALKLLYAEKPQLVLLDIAMPEMDGYEFCKIVKEDANTRHIPIIFISAFEDPKEVVKGFALGGDDYIIKPFIPELVKARVGVHLRNYIGHRKLQDMNRKLQMSVNEQVKQLENEKKSVLYALAHVAMENASYSEEHMERMQYNSQLLAQAMQLSSLYEGVISDTYIDTIGVAVPLCDIGNVAVPMEILQKHSGLTPEETAIMQHHTTIGAKMLQDINKSGDYNDYLQMSVDIAHYHHENWDGTGYPSGLKGSEIPLPAQIVSIVGTYCALTEKRAYREAYSKDEALDIMKNEAGKKYCTEIFDICQKIFRQLQ